MTLAVGVMSGTSLDGISAALVRLGDTAVELVAFRQEPYSAAERGSIIDTMARGTPKDVAFLHVALGERFAGAVLALLAQARVAPKDLSFIASHGQTIWHEPGRATFQLGDAARRARGRIRLRHGPGRRSHRCDHAARRSRCGVRRGRRASAPW